MTTSSAAVRLVRSVIVEASIVVLTVLVAQPASADVSGPCSGNIEGTSVDSGHFTASSAIHVDATRPVEYAGRSKKRGVSFIDVSLEIGGVSLTATDHQRVRGRSWSNTVRVDKFTWAGIGLYLVRATAFARGGRAICEASAFICIDGKNPLLTVAGATSGGLAAGGLGLILVSLLRRRRASRAGLAARLGAGGLLAGAAAPVLMQQTCVLPLSPVSAGVFAGGGLVAMATLGSLAGRAKVRRLRGPNAS